MRMMAPCWLAVVLIGICLVWPTCGNGDENNKNIHAVVVSSSRYWFNYRHAVNALTLYDLLHANGVPPENMVLMLADEYAGNARNPYKNGLYAQGVHSSSSLYGSKTYIDYRGLDVTVDNFLQVLVGTTSTGRTRRVMESNENSTVLIYISGHGGDQFFKFQDEQEVTAQDLAVALDRMYQAKKYKQLLFIADTCQAFTLFDHVKAPNVVAIGSSLRNENAYAHHGDSDLGLSVIERYTHGVVNQQVPRHRNNKDPTLRQVLLDPFGWNPDPSKASDRPLGGAHVGVLSTMSLPLESLYFGDFFGRPLGQNEEEDDLFEMAWETKRAILV